MEAIQDRWAQWLLHRRFGGDPKRREEVLNALGPVRDRVLEQAALRPGHVVLDVGTGDGLIAFGALSQVGTDGKVIFNEISQDLLTHSQTLVEQMGLQARCAFLHASAEDLSALPDASVDAVTTRSVLIYVADKERAFQEFYRVLKPGGRISCFEPINRFGYSDAPDRFWGYDVGPIQEIAAKVRAVYTRLQPPSTDPMLNFDERDLIEIAFRAGFSPVHLRFEAELNQGVVLQWKDLWQVAGNPRIPTLEEAVQQALSPEEAERFVAYLHPTVETETIAGRSAVAYLWAVK